MPESIKVKVCGITRREDAQSALELGADAIGINFYQLSPRFVSLDEARNLIATIPPGKRIMVDVSPTPNDLRQRLDLGFDYFQIHFPLSTDDATIAEWSYIVSSERLWLSPRISQGEVFPERLLEFAGTFLIDAPSDQLYGGTGHTGNWEAFRLLQNRHPEKNWILAGGLSPENISNALQQSGAKYIDVNSGVETSPGIKNPERLKVLFNKIRYPE